MSNLILTNSPVKQQVETTIFNYRSKELFINLKDTDIPPVGHPDRNAFIDYEEEKCTIGVTVNGIFIPPTFYWDICHWAIMREVRNSRGIKEKFAGRPDIRDNDWIIHNSLHIAERNRKNLLLGTARQVSKSKNTASVFGRDLMLFDNRTNLLMAGAAVYLGPIMEYLFIGTENCSEFFRVPRLTRDKKSTHIKWGFKTPQNEDIVKSSLHIRNADGGKNTEVSAGLTIDRAAVDEIATFPYRSSFETILPALISDDGIRSSSILSFTGGNAEKSKDAEESFMNPEGGGFQKFTFKNQETALFMGGWYRQDLKVVKNFGEFLSAPEGSELYDLNIRVADFELADKVLDEEEATAAKSQDPGALIKKKMYNPREISHMFLTENTNPFPIDALMRHKEFLLANPVGTPYEIFRGPDGTPVLKETHKKPIHKYPLLSTDIYVDKDAPVMIYDKPKYQDNYNLHILGNDAFNQDHTMESDSLGSIYVMRREHSDLEDSFQNVMVASWTGRPTHKRFLEILELLQELYNGEILFEDSGGGVLSYFDNKNKAYVLMDTMDLQKEINPKNKAGNRKGLKATERVNSRRLAATIDYLEEDMGDGVLGLTRILDPVLIDELIAFNGMGKGTKNTDRFDAFSFALLQLNSLQKFLMYRPFIVNRPTAPVRKEREVRNAFGFSNSMFEKRRREF